jgi:DNA-directed RNA polymerase specialized sigma24 family protein
MEDEEQRTDGELLLAARVSAEPFGVFYERHFASVLAFFRRRTRGPEEAFDLAAETFAAGLAAVPRFQPGLEPAQAWLCAIARNKLSESVRRGRIHDEAWRALAMQPIELDEEAVELLEETADGPAVALPETLALDRAKPSRVVTSKSAATPRSHATCAALGCGTWSPDNARLACEGFGLTDPSLNGRRRTSPRRAPS